MLKSILLIMGIIYGRAAARVVGDQCVYTRNERIIEKTFNATAELCCSMSGVHYRYQQGLEAKCCGEKIYKPEAAFCCNGEVYKKYIILNNCEMRFMEEDFGSKNDAFPPAVNVTCN